jgi:hypothetical protein
LKKTADLTWLQSQAILAPTTLKLQTFKAPKIAKTIPAAFCELNGAYHFTFTHFLQRCHPHSLSSQSDFIDMHSDFPFLIRGCM